MFQCTFAATCATIVSGSIAERGNFNGYIIFAMLITGIVYPIQVRDPSLSNFSALTSHTADPLGLV